MGGRDWRRRFLRGEHIAMQDLPVECKMVYDLWRQRKMQARAAQTELILSRAVGAERFVRMVDFHENYENSLSIDAIVEKHRDSVDDSLGVFRWHPLIDEFLAQFKDNKPERGMRLRFKALLLRGETRSGKTRKAISLFGSGCTFETNAQGMAPDLPNIEAFDREKHAAIVWDEIVEQQVLCNKLCFQSGVGKVAFQQSKCNAHSYQKYLYGVPQILCSNVFSMTGPPDKPLRQEDADWLSQNIIEVRLEPGEKWFYEECEMRTPPRGRTADI